MRYEHGTLIRTPRETLAAMQHEEAAQLRLADASKTAKHRALHTAHACDWRVMAERYAAEHGLEAL